MSSLRRSSLDGGGGAGTSRAAHTDAMGCTTDGARTRRMGGPMVGTLGWALIFAAMTAWEGLSLSLGGKQWPTMSDMARAVTRPVWGRWMFFALWLWFGWHYFMRGWTFPLRGHAPGGGDGGLGHPK